jgi:hypothetical protein
MTKAKASSMKKFSRPIPSEEIFVILSPAQLMKQELMPQLRIQLKLE